ncbi:Killer toxin subunits alpha/beta [Fulvia fulva]|uniref:Killer toxin subunits alpha/beta n=1 Tax=Passalora fulva TaxID=5499 RepID=A0A9Q8UV57_PASFU|nr:Killer toxin subunits alpha/beta [Fulvia fulva]KAK4611783.1 Killer toxin subunits alpha/beta [Fulvia fulva]KAK4612928.1 Killer toxin subunits alpha/beta [Fulvia fulva]UJO23633.1 Killer toxin subunits alpha/beta [Fulvia fulva]WPV21501.1 Killer toxin subunits alpha/beta [Fulvia fulva]WPV36452.1 Killer toxin subunits alpha/beta [Fulvia fulva]
MTYDLHGQWDHGNTFTNLGCPNGNCLRSQINQTKTESALSMLTKAGVDSSKIMLGQPLYGRSFKMTDPSCYTAECTFTGPSIGAQPGDCTGTPGYIANLEIRNIINGGEYDVQQYNSLEAGDILVYGGNWVSWMTGLTYYRRSDYARGLGLGGTSDWAIDLNYTGDAGGGSGGNNSTNGTGSGVVTIDPSIYGNPNPQVTCQPPCTFVLPPWTLPYTTTITPAPVTSSIVDYWPYVTTISGTVTSTLYISKTTVTTITPAPVTTTEIPVSNVEWTDTDQSIIFLTSSVILPPVTLTQDSTVYTTDGMTITIPGITYKYSQGPYPPVTRPTPGTTSSPGMAGNPTSTETPTSSSTYGIFPPPTSCGSCPPSITPIIGPPGPLCKTGCVIQCILFCSPELPCIGPQCNCIGVGCPGGGGCVGPGCSGSDSDNPGDNAPSDPDEEDKCEIDISTGLRDNGNFPVFDASTGQISCDGSMEPGECQQRIDNNMESVQNQLESDQQCCPTGSGAKLRRRESNGMLTNLLHDASDSFGALFKRQGGSCPQPASDPRRPAQGQCLVTYTCPPDLFPGVCGNAKSAIQDRGMTSILSHITGSSIYKTEPWHKGHFKWKSGTPKGGWKLDCCEVEEYPFGAGNPNRNPTGDRIFNWDNVPTLRLIPGGRFGLHLENQTHANHLKAFLNSVKQDYSLPNLNRIVYCVDFPAGFDNFIPENSPDNFCAVAYGEQSTLVNGTPTRRRSTSLRGPLLRAYDNCIAHEHLQRAFRLPECRRSTWMRDSL